ncbi:unknown [Eubacterium sp. CAG:115]|nr:unknown [Eubacterium sp. CAG:115]
MKNSRSEKWTGRKFKVTVHLPDGLSESVRQSKIDRLYDILKSKSAENENKNDDENNDNT